MTNPQTVEVPMSQLMAGITVNVRLTGVTVALWRLRLAMALIALAARVGGFRSANVEVEPE